MYVHFPSPVLTNIFILYIVLDPGFGRSQSLVGALNGIIFMETHPPKDFRRLLLETLMLEGRF